MSTASSVDTTNIQLPIGSLGQETNIYTFKHTHKISQPKCKMASKIAKTDRHQAKNASFESLQEHHVYIWSGKQTLKINEIKTFIETP